MKAGDKVPVTIAGQTVAQATVKETGEGTATLVVPATLVVMATRTELAAPEPVESEGAGTIITGVETQSGEQSAVVGEPAPVAETAAPVENVEPAPTVEPPVAPAPEAPVAAPVDAGAPEPVAPPTEAPVDE